MTYLIHDNNTRPFRVVIYNSERISEMIDRKIESEHNFEMIDFDDLTLDSIEITKNKCDPDSRPVIGSNKNPGVRLDFEQSSKSDANSTLLNLLTGKNEWGFSKKNPTHFGGLKVYDNEKNILIIDTIFESAFIPFDGNTILLHLGEFKYLFIGKEIYTFIAYDKIIKFESPINEYDVSYPYAVDDNQFIYLFYEKLIYPYFKDEILNFNPYDYYDYNLSEISDKKLYIDGSPYLFNFSIYPQQKYLALKKFLGDDVRFNNAELTEEMFIEMNKKHAKKHNILPIDKINVVYRRGGMKQY